MNLNRRQLMATLGALAVAPLSAFAKFPSKGISAKPFGGVPGMLPPPNGWIQWKAGFDVDKLNSLDGAVVKGLALAKEAGADLYGGKILPVYTGKHLLTDRRLAYLVWHFPNLKSAEQYTTKNGDLIIKRGKAIGLIASDFNDHHVLEA